MRMPDNKPNVITVYHFEMLENIMNAENTVMIFHGKFPPSFKFGK
jgi:hypothetical protein